MPTSSKTSTAGKSKTSTSKTTASSKPDNSKKQGTVNIKTTSAREKARGFDEGRRSAANSNEL